MYCRVLNGGFVSNYTTWESINNFSRIVYTIVVSSDIYTTIFKYNLQDSMTIWHCVIVEN